MQSWELGREGFPLSVLRTPYVASSCARSRVLPGPGLGFRESWTGVEAPPEPFSIRRFGDDVKSPDFTAPKNREPNPGPESAEQLPVVEDQCSTHTTQL